MQPLFVFAFLIAVVSAGSWKELPCNGNQECILKFNHLKFVGNSLTFLLSSSQTVPLIGGETTISTEGYGCIFLFCSWANGPIVKSPTCDWDTLNCKDGVVLAPGEVKEASIDFSEAINEAKKTTGCCSIDRSCDCMIKGISSIKSTQFPASPEIARVYMEFYCDSTWKNCHIVRPKAEEEVLELESH